MMVRLTAGQRPTLHMDCGGTWTQSTSWMEGQRGMREREISGEHFWGIVTIFWAAPPTFHLMCHQNFGVHLMPPDGWRGGDVWPGCKTSDDTRPRPSRSAGLKKP